MQYSQGPCCWQDLFINTVTKTLERKNSKEQEVQSGWFTPEEMAHTLGWSKNLVWDSISFLGIPY